MGGEWTKYRIEEVAERVAMGPFGSSIKVETFVPDGVPVISGQHLHGFRLDDTPGYNFITPEHAERLRNANVLRGDVVLTHRGTIGQIAYIPATSAHDRYVVSQSQFYLRPDQSKVLPEFLVAYFRSPEGQHKLLANTSQVGVPSIAQPVTYLRSLEIPLPPLPEQRAIAHILGTLDDKIELNRRQNETLEAMARALFRAWFVDFEPVRAKMNLPSPSGRGAGGEVLPSPPGRGAGGEVLPSPPGRGAGGEGAPNPTKPKLPSDLLDFARALRHRMTDAEALLWRLLRNRQLAGVKFRRQHPFPPYVLDFYCHEHKLAVEIDGGQHNEVAGQQHDARRDAFLAEHGLRVLRFWNHDVLQQPEAVLEAIFQAIEEHRLPSPPPPLPEGEGSWGALGADGVWQWPPHILDLFPDRLVGSELGEIPEGWECVAASKIIEFNPPESLRKGADAPYIEMAALPVSGSWPEPPIFRPFGSGMRFRNGDTLLARITPCLENGKTAFIQCLPDNTVGWGSTEYIVMRPKPPVPPEFGYLLARDAAFREQAIRSMTGTSGRQRVQADSVAAFKLAAPTLEAVWDAFSCIVASSFKAIKANAEAITTLAHLRDTLLPKLISGELRVKDAEAFLKERGL